MSMNSKITFPKWISGREITGGNARDHFKLVKFLIYQLDDEDNTSLKRLKHMLAEIAWYDTSINDFIYGKLNDCVYRMPSVTSVFMSLEEMLNDHWKDNRKIMKALRKMQALHFNAYA